MTAWAAAYTAAVAMEWAEEQAAALRDRCPCIAGLTAAQCTADASPEHVHRYEAADLPGFDPTYY